MLQLCYSLRCKKQSDYFAYALTLFCVCPQGVLRMPAKCFAHARKVAWGLVAPCAKAYLTLFAGFLPPARPFCAYGEVLSDTQERSVIFSDLKV